MAHRASKLAELSRELPELADRLQLVLAERAHASLRPTPQLVRLVLGLRLLAAEHFVPSLGQPARNMLLALYAAELEGKVLTPNRLAAASREMGTHRCVSPISCSCPFCPRPLLTSSDLFTGPSPCNRPHRTG